MPLHFRCPHCNQLMGIARRKSGTLIHCPTCTKQLLVPRSAEPSAPERPAEMAEKPAAPDALTQRPNSLLEKLDVDAILNPPAPGKAVAAVKVKEEQRPSPQPSSGAPPPRLRPEPERSALAAGRARSNSAAAKANGADPDLPSLALGPKGRGIFLSPARLTVLGVIGVALLGLAFVLGLLVGRQM